MYQAKGVETQQIYAEASNEQELHRALNKKFSKRGFNKKDENLLPESIRIIKKLTLPGSRNQQHK